ncbi:MAG TPA: hypothetical protein VK116_14835, partial [Planctomycetota bacterium]|nr:hypothetical protein [Planctomycetota bacterium]
MSDDPKSASVPEGAGHPGEPARSPTPTPLAGDFTAGLGLVWLSLLAVPVGALCAGVAYCLIQLIG